MLPALQPPGETSGGTTFCLKTGYNYYKGEGTTLRNGIMAINPNGNTWNPVNIAVNNEGDLTGGGGKFTNTGNGYYQSTNGASSFRVSKRLHSVEAPGNFTLNGGVTVRVYYTDSDTMSMRTNAFPGGAPLAAEGWFKQPAHIAAITVAAMNPMGVTGGSKITPSARGIENGLKYVEFKVQNFSTFGYYTSSLITALPLQLLSFSGEAKHCEAVLHWQTSFEQNFSHFELMYSSDGLQFTSIAHIPGTNTRSHQYFSSYMQPIPKGYYQLKMVDLDGTTVYSDIITTQIRCAEQKPVIYPNPVLSTCTIDNIQPGDEVNISSVTGIRLLQHIAVTTRKHINIDNYATGVYIVTIMRKGQKILYTKLIKTK